MKKVLLNFLLFFSVILLSSCSKNNTYQIPSSIKNTELATVYIYRTNSSFHMFNPEKPFFYIDEKYIGKLGTGQELVIKVIPGEHIFTVKDSILFMPGLEDGKVKINIEKNKTYYLRYSLTPANIISSNNSQDITITGNSNFQKVNEEYFSYRK